MTNITPCAFSMLSLWSRLALVLAACFGLAAAVGRAGRAGEAAPVSARSPADELPPGMSRIAWFGERADWSHDGKRVLFLGKTYGDVYEVEVATRIIRPVTHHFYHGGFTEPSTSPMRTSSSRGR